MCAGCLLCRHALHHNGPFTCNLHKGLRKFDKYNGTSALIKHIKQYHFERLGKADGEVVQLGEGAKTMVANEGDRAAVGGLFALSFLYNHPEMTHLHPVILKIGQGLERAVDVDVLYLISCTNTIFAAVTILSDGMRKYTKEEMKDKATIGAALLATGFSRRIGKILLGKPVWKMHFDLPVHQVCYNAPDPLTMKRSLQFRTGTFLLKDHTRDQSSRSIRYFLDRRLQSVYGMRL